MQNAQYLDIRQIAEQTEKDVMTVDTVSTLMENDVFWIFRSSEETDENP